MVSHSKTVSPVSCKHVTAQLVIFCWRQTVCFRAHDSESASSYLCDWESQSCLYVNEVNNYNLLGSASTFKALIIE